MEAVEMSRGQIYKKIEASEHRISDELDSVSTQLSSLESRLSARLGLPRTGSSTTLGTEGGSEAATGSEGGGALPPRPRPPAPPGLERGQSGEEGDAVNADLDVLGRLERLENRLEAVVAALEQRAGQGTSALV